MSVDPVATAEGLTAFRKAAAPGAAPATSFSEVLEASSRQEQVSVTTAAEILRLKMMNSAVDLGNQQQNQATRGFGGVQGVLDRFLEQVAKPAAAAIDDEEDAVATDAAGSGGGGAEGVVTLTAATEAIIRKAAARFGIDGALIKAVIRAESEFNPRAVSSAGAKGLMQLMPSTARGLGVRDPFDPEQNVMAGTRFLKDMLSRYGGNLDEALAAYNWGPGNVDRHGAENLPHETSAYLAKVKRYYSRYAA